MTGFYLFICERACELILQGHTPIKCWGRMFKDLNLICSHHIDVLFVNEKRCITYDLHWLHGWLVPELSCGLGALLASITELCLGLIYMKDGWIWWIWHLTVNDGDFIAGEQPDLLRIDNDTVGLIQLICFKGLI